MNAKTDANVVRRNRAMLIALFALFFGGMLVAGLLRFSGWRPQGMKNKGELLQPYGDLRDYVPQLLSGGDYRWQDSPRTWRIVVMPRECDGVRVDACTRLLQGVAKVWQLLGKDADRVHVLWAGALPAGQPVPRVLRRVRVDARLQGQLARWEDPAGDPAWLLDPNGFVVLRYAPGFDPGDLRTDLVRLLKIN